MLGRHHQIATVALTLSAGTISGLAVSHPILLVFGIYGSAIGALCPDIDSPKSIISQHHRFLAGVFSNSKHRGFTHSILAWLLYSGCLYLVFKFFNMFDHTVGLVVEWICLGLSLGYLLHLFEDSFSRAGIRWLWPLTVSPYDDKYGICIKRYRGRDGHWHNLHHSWGRGYRVGGTCEQLMVSVSILVIALNICWLLKYYL